MLQRSTTDPTLRPLRPFGWLAVGAGVRAGAAGRDHRDAAAADADLDRAHGHVAAVLPDGALHRRPLAAGAGRRASAAPPPSVPRLALVAAVAVYFQMVLGGLVRHSGAALACTDVPLCRGSLWPDAHPTVLIQALHRLNGVAVALLVFASSIVTLRAARGRGATCARWRSLAPVLVVVQIALGIRAVTSFLDLATVEAHLAVATALLATQVLIVLRARSDGRARARRASRGSRAWSASASRASRGW